MDGEANEIERKLVMCISALHPCRCPQLRGPWGPGPHASEIRAKNWTWAMGGGLLAARGGRGPLLSATPS